MKTHATPVQPPFRAHAVPAAGEHAQPPEGPLAVHPNAPNGGAARRAAGRSREHGRPDGVEGSDLPALAGASRAASDSPSPDVPALQTRLRSAVRVCRPYAAAAVRGYLVFEASRLGMYVLLRLTGDSAEPVVAGAAAVMASLLGVALPRLGMLSATAERMLPAMTALAGPLTPATVAVGRGLASSLTVAQLRCVLAHELAHIAEPSWWRPALAVASSVAGAALPTGGWASVLPILGRQYVLRQWEHRADAAAAAVCGAQVMVGVLETMDPSTSGWWEPLRWVGQLFLPRPSTADRAARLLGPA